MTVNVLLLLVSQICNYNIITHIILIPFINIYCSLLFQDATPDKKGLKTNFIVDFIHTSCMFKSTVVFI